MYTYSIFISKASDPIQQEEIASLFNESKSLNAKHNVTGMLACIQGKRKISTETHFMQVLEGDQLEVEQVSERIKQDSRYGNLRMLKEAYIEERNFDTWQTGAESINLEEHQELEKFFEIESDIVRNNNLPVSNLILDFLKDFYYAHISEHLSPGSATIERIAI